MLELRKSLNITDDSFWNVEYEPCGWAGVTCGMNDTRVVHLVIKNLTLIGTLPESLGKLTKLITFDAGYNIIYGPLPDFNGSVELSTLIVDFNQLSSIPESLFHSKPNLSFVSLNYNTYLLPWKIPEGLKNATNLRHFSAFYCNIYGPFPDFFTGDNFPGLAHLHLAYNNFSGQVPQDLPGSLETLWLDHQGDTHSLSGDISFVQNLTRLTSLWLNENQFSGEIPDLSGHQFLEEFVMCCNNLSGSVPESLSNISSLLRVDLSKNKLTGSYPWKQHRRFSQP
ncbi:unnamed protein product [Cuscuta europaea]|uniref:Leucine-rich repeat-containing N-terminal plant-type domain-containing protein n=1 Tax=Cuscuta europaea TaxID=41803 RepID=A0A9P0ZVY3_CUSEU|nr:unnamed protein product [Cuscuta europaea]